MESTPSAVLLAIGSELVSGASQDSNCRHAARELAALGLRVQAILVLADELDAIARPLARALEEADLILVSGGLGPTVDDLTREAVAGALGVELEERLELLEAIEARYRSMGRSMPPANRRQAFLPVGAAALPNPRGTAPGVVWQGDGKLLTCLPGVPHEFLHMFRDQVLPRTRELFGERLRPRGERCMLVTGVAESVLGPVLAPFMERGVHPELGVTAKMGAITLRLSAHAASAAEVEELLDAREVELRGLLGQDLCRGYPVSAEEAAVRGLTEVALVDALGGGDLAGRLHRAGVPVVSFTGGFEHLRELLPDSPVSLEGTAWTAFLQERTGADAAVAMLPGEDGTWVVTARLGDQESSVILHPGEHPELDARRSQGHALDLLRRMGEACSAAAAPAGQG